MRIKILKGGVFLMMMMVSISLFSQNNIREDMQKYSSALNIINQAYVEQVNTAELTQEAIKAMLKELDPHSAYFTKEEIKAADEPLQGNFEGIGVQFQIFLDTIIVISPIPGGPSAKVGIMAGDKIVKIDGATATGEILTNKFVRDHLRGKKGSEVVLGIKRGSRKDIIDFTVVRDKIPINSVDAGFMMDHHTGVIKISRFAGTTLKEFHTHFNKLEKQGMKNLILDLRGNPGGYMQTAIDLADEFISGDKVLVFTKGRSSMQQDFNARKKGVFEKGKLIVLLDEGSASASEIVSGAIQDYGRGLVVGRRSFGKGLVQRPFQLPDSAVIRLTVAQYYTPSGRCIQKPYNKGKEDYFKEILARKKHGEMLHADSISFPDSLKYESFTGKTVYGGGGIMPDIFIPWDSTGYNDFYVSLIKNSIPNSFVLKYVEKHRKVFTEKYPDLKTFIQDFIIDDQMMSEFREMAVKKDIVIDEDQYQESLNMVKTILKALFSQHFFTTEAYYEVIVDIDKTLLEAAKMMNQDELFIENKIDIEE